MRQAVHTHVQIVLLYESTFFDSVMLTFAPTTTYNNNMPSTETIVESVIACVALNVLLSLYPPGKCY